MHGSAVTANMALQDLSPTEGGRVLSKVDRERRSFGPLKGKQKVSPRFSMQDPTLARHPTFKATTNGTNGIVDSFSEVSPDFRLQNNFDHEIILSGQQTTENLQHAVTA